MAAAKALPPARRATAVREGFLGKKQGWPPTASCWVDGLSRGFHPNETTPNSSLPIAHMQHACIPMEMCVHAHIVTHTVLLV